MAESDVFGDAKRAVEAWDEAEYYAQQMVGGLLAPQCPKCEMTVGAMVMDGPDPVFADVQCPACTHVWSERVVG